MTAPRVPHSPPSGLRFTSSDLVTWTDPLVRIASAQGPYVLPFGALRTYGPVPGCRWDPHPPGAGPARHPSRWGVLYTSSTLTGACAETGQRHRVIDRRTGSVYLEWAPTRALRLLDMTATGTWLIRNGAAASLTSIAPKHCQRWAHAIATHAGNSEGAVAIDGLLVPSVWTGHNVVLMSGSADSFPSAPRRSVSLSDPALLPVLTKIAAHSHRGGARVSRLMLPCRSVTGPRSTPGVAGCAPPSSGSGFGGSRPSVLLAGPYRCLVL